tara:strand:- start:5738 stop:6181 length:444 start_codon:yes stop_codon:yes gene_type:complete
MITTAIEKALKRAKEEKWDKTFWVFDIHGTIFPSNWSADETASGYYPYAKAVLQFLTAHPEFNMILWSCSPDKKIEQYVNNFHTDSIVFDHVGHNPDVANNEYGNYRHKMYMNVLFEDKAGFDPGNDWWEVFMFFGLKQDTSGNWVE